jgi:biotin carboxylase
MRKYLRAVRENFSAIHARKKGDLMKNFVLISPHFPTNFLPFAARLKEAGMRTLGIADAAYESLPEELRRNLTEYYRVDDMEDYNQVYKAVAFFAFKYGKIDRIESHNEHWLALDARLRQDFNVLGYRPEDVDIVTHKSKMKKVFRQIGLPVANGRVFSGTEDALSLAEELGYPVIVKPDNGVGAGDTYKLGTKEELQHFLDQHAQYSTYIMEEFIPGEMVTFDGLTNREGKIVFYSSLTYNAAVLETVEQDEDMYFFLPRLIPNDLIEMGTKMVDAFGIPERFFHFEFFRTYPDGELMPLEVNMRPPGGPTIDMFNYVNDFDIFREYASIVTADHFQAPIRRLYNCGYVSRKYDKHHYTRSAEELRKELGSALIAIQTIPGIFSAILGDEGYLIRYPEIDDLFAAIQLIREKDD